jgi:gliding motility-associated protein GldE
LFSGLAAWLVRNSDMIEKKIDSRNKAITLEELDHAIDITTENAASEKEKNILKGIVKFGNISVKQIMRTRMDVNGIEYKSPFNEVVKKAEELHYSRLPVYKNKLDEVVGILHTKDLLPYLDQPPSFDWHQLLRQPYFVHEQKLIEDLLKEFQQKRIHFAVVVDEFGGTSGIVTLEDIIEEIIGDIKDEFDDDDSDYKKLDDNNYIFEGKSMIHDVCKAMKLATDTFDGVKGQSDSLAGLVLEVAGEIPQPNQVISVGDFDFTVLEVVKNRLKKIKVTIKPLQTD